MSLDETLCRNSMVHSEPDDQQEQVSSISKETKNILDLQSALLESLTSNEQMMSAEKLLRTLLEGDYFKNGNDDRGLYEEINCTEPSPDLGIVKPNCTS